MDGVECSEDHRLCYDQSDEHLMDYASASISNHVATEDIMRSGRARAQKRWVTVEVIVMLIAASYGGLATLQGQYLRMRVSNYLSNGTNLPANASLCDAGNATAVLQAEIQKVTSQWNLYLGSTSTFLGMFSTLVLGTLSERYGRRFAIIIPCLGFLAQCIVCLCVVNFELPLNYFFIASALTGLSGGLSLFMASCFSYIADITTEKQRMIRIVIVELLIFAGISAMEMGLGYMIQNFGFALSLWVPFAATIIGLTNAASTYLLIETVCQDSKDGEQRTITSIIQDIKHLYVINTDNRRRVLIVCSVVALLMNIVIQGSISMTVLYGQGQPFCWQPVTIGFYTTISLIVPGIGCITGAGIFQCCKVGYMWVAQIACLSCVANTLVIAMTFLWQSTEVLFASTFFGILKLLGVPVIRTFMSTIVENKEHGALFASIGVLDSLSMFAAPILLNGVYAATVHILSTAVFFFMSAVLVIPSILIGIMQCSNVEKKRRPLEINREPDEQEALLTKSE